MFQLFITQISVVRNFILVRADIARLPFVTSSVDAVHAGAALHCWPSPSAAVSLFLYLNFTKNYSIFLEYQWLMAMALSKTLNHGISKGFCSIVSASNDEEH